MPLLDGGRDHFVSDLIGESVTKFDNTNAHIAVGNSSVVFDSSHTDLQGASFIRKAMADGYPQRNGNILTFRALFEEEEANFDWEEFGVANALSGGTLLTRAVEFLGTKPDTQAWRFTVNIEVNHAADLQS